MWTWVRSANPALGEGAQEVQPGCGLVVRLHHPCRVGHPGGGVGDVVVDHVTAERRQLHAVHDLRGAGARLGELPGRARELHDRQRRAVGQHGRHLQHDLEVVADARRREVAEGLGAVAHVEQEPFTGGHAGQGLTQLTGLAGEHERRRGADSSVTASTTAGSGQSGCWSAGRARQELGVQSVCVSRPRCSRLRRAQASMRSTAASALTRVGSGTTTSCSSTSSHSSPSVATAFSSVVRFMLGHTA